MPVGCADLGCGLGGDTLALAAAGPAVLAVNNNPLRLALTTANACALGQSACVHPLRADIRCPAWRPLPGWADPGRRAGRRRLFDPETLQPPLSALLAGHGGRHPDLGIKLMPGLAHEAIPDGAEAEWISLDGALKQVVLWFGGLARGAVRRATVLPAGSEIVAADGEVAIRPPGAYLYEPDPAVIRAGAVSDLAVRLGLWSLDPTIAYLSGDVLVDTPFARVWSILEHGPFDLKALNRRLRSLDGNVVAVKKRGSPIDPEAFRRRLYQNPGGRQPCRRHHSASGQASLSHLRTTLTAASGNPKGLAILQPQFVSIRDPSGFCRISEPL